MKEITIQKSENSFNFQLPDKCIYCGMKREQYVNLKFTKSTSVAGMVFFKDKKDEIIINNIKSFGKVKVPFCNVHAKETKLYSKILSLSMIFVFTLSLFLLIKSQGPFDDIDDFFKTIDLGTMLGYIFLAASFGGIFGFLLRLVLKNFYKSLEHYQLPIFSGFGYIGVVLGLLIKVKDDIIILKVNNEDIANEILT